MQDPSSSIVNSFSKWMKDTTPISDCSGSYLEISIPRGTILRRRGEEIRHFEGMPELVTVNRRADSWMTSFFKRSFVKFFFIVGFRLAASA
jgi:hypothetical protein